MTLIKFTLNDFKRRSGTKQRKPSSRWLSSIMPYGTKSKRSPLSSSKQSWSSSSALELPTTLCRNYCNDGRNQIRFMAVVVKQIVSNPFIIRPWRGHQTRRRLNHRLVYLDTALCWNRKGHGERITSTPCQIVIERNETVRKYAQSKKLQTSRKRQKTLIATAPNNKKIEAEQL